MSSSRVDFSYYHPVTKNQEEFHKSKARHKLLIGGVGGGKTYPAIHEAIFHCLENPGHTTLAARNTWDRLNEGLMDDIIRVCKKTGCMKDFISSKKDLILVNDHRIMFRPLSIGQEGFKGMHLSSFIVDDPDFNKYSEDISFLFTRLRNPPDEEANRFQSIITANWEGRNWAWRTYMRNREPGGDDTFAYWICPTTDNPTLHENYISDLEKMHSPEWMDRYVYCKNNTFAGLVFPEFSPQLNGFNREAIKDRKDLIKILTIDIGLVNPTAVMKMATDGAVIFTYGEWYRKGVNPSELIKYLQDELRQTHYHKIIIDPSSAKGEQVSGTSMKRVLQKAGIPTMGGDNAVIAGISLMRDLICPSSGPPRFYVDLQSCPNWAKEVETYRWKEPKDMDFDAMSFREEPVKKNDHALDASRYGTVYLQRYLKGLRVSDFLAEKRERYRTERYTKLKHFDMYPGMRKQAIYRRTLKRIGCNDQRIKDLIANIR